MNQLRGNIQGIESTENMSLVDVSVAGDIFCAVLLETPAGVPYLKMGEEVTLLFKETEVSLGKNLSGLISLRNRFKSRIKRIEKGKILTKVTLDYRNQEITSIITTRSFQHLGLKEKEDVEWLVKTNEITILKEN